MTSLRYRMAVLIKELGDYNMRKEQDTALAMRERIEALQAENYNLKNRVWELEND